METRITIDLRDPQLLKLLRLEAAKEGKTLRELVVAALESYFSGKRENQAIMKLAEKVFSEFPSSGLRLRFPVETVGETLAEELGF